jgi:hypothetical protein
MPPLTAHQKIHFALEKLLRFSPSEYRSALVSTPDICRPRSQLEHALSTFDLEYPGLCDENGIDVLGLRRSVERERQQEEELAELAERTGAFGAAAWGLGGHGGDRQRGGVRRSMDSMGIHKAGRRDTAKERLERVGSRVRRVGSRLVVSTPGLVISRGDLKLIGHGSNR